MASTSSRSKLWRIVDQLTLLQIGIFAAILTLLPAIGYWLLSIFTESSYIAERGVRDKSFLSALYFSFVSAVTIGSQDITPHGWARLILCVQVTGGLVLAGFGIAKLTSLHGRQMRSVIHGATGLWIEPCCLPDGKILVSLSNIYEADGEIFYDGENFDSSGKPRGFFSSHFISSANMILKFRYSNHDSCTDYFGDGITSHRFIPDPKSGIWNRHHATCKDFDKGFSIEFEGYRASDAEVDIINGSDASARIRLIKAHIKRAMQARRADAAPGPARA